MLLSLVTVEIRNCGSQLVGNYTYVQQSGTLCSHRVFL